MRAEDNVVEPLRLIVGGGIGSGKSTVLRMLQTLGVVVIEADRIGNRLLEPDGVAYDDDAARWHYVVENGRIDRKLLADIVFSDAAQLSALEAMTHPHIGEAILQRADAVGNRDVAVELPVASDLLGPGWTRVVVVVPEEVRIRRARERGEDVADVVRRVESQPSDAEWQAWADHVLRNTGTVGDLEAAVIALWRQLRGRA